MKLPKINKRLKTKWVKALRSGEYLQGSGVLVDRTLPKPSYCCLGVLAVVCGISNETMADHAYLSSTGIERDDLLGPAHINADESKDSIQIKLAKMNDAGKSFKYIASYIERYL